MKQLASLFIPLLLFTACGSDKDGKPKCPTYDIIPSSPYQEPLCHPSGEVIGFNHTPIKEIKYTNGYECPHQATYIWERDSAGFWLINADGTNQRRILPYYLYSPCWSPNGKWIAFMKGLQIFTMPFDGQNFDTTAIVQLTFEGRNFYPAWSPDQKRIAYDNTDCGSATTPPPPNSCGLLVMDADGNNKKFVGSGRMPYWDNTTEYLYTAGVKYQISTGNATTFFDIALNNIAIEDAPKFNPMDIIGFTGYYTNLSPRFLRFFTISSKGENLKTISDNSIPEFSWLPDGRIVYLSYDYTRIDEMKGTLWVMNSDGTSQKQLTFNRFSVIIQ